MRLRGRVGRWTGTCGCEGPGSSRCWPAAFAKQSKELLGGRAVWVKGEPVRQVRGVRGGKAEGVVTLEAEGHLGKNGRSGAEADSVARREAAHLLGFGQRCDERECHANVLATPCADYVTGYGSPPVPVRGTVERHGDNVDVLNLSCVGYQRHLVIVVASAVDVCWMGSGPGLRQGSDLPGVMVSSGRS